MTIKLRHWFFLFMLPFLSGCYPEGADYAEDLGLVYTNYSSTFNFSVPKTYAIPDSVIKITGDAFNDPDGDKKPTFLPATYATPLINEIKKNMASNGWTLVSKTANPDVVLLPSSMTTTNIYYYYDWGYWNWWYPDYYPWGWYYPGWYYPGYVSGYRSGSVFLQMIDNKTAHTSESIPVVWNCILNGLAEGSTTDLNNRIATGIGKAFNQSPYLKH